MSSIKGLSLNSEDPILTNHTYNMNIKIDPKSGLLQGDQQATFYNFYSVALKSIGFTLDFNLSRVKGYSMSVEIVSDDLDEEFEWEHPDINGALDKSLLLVRLKKEIYPGEKVRLKLKFHGNLRPVPSGDYLKLTDSYFGFPGSPSYYPRFLNLRNGKWQMGSYRDYVSASYRVVFIIPKEQILASSGVVLKEEIAGNSERMVFLKAENVRGFGLAMSPNFRIYEDRFQDIVIRSYYFPGQEDRAKKLADYAKDILSFYVSDVGFYPWKNLAILPGSHTSTGGYAASNIIFIHMPEPHENFLRWITAHEIAHQYWGVYVGDPNDYPKWLSLGLTQWLDERYEKSTNPQLHRKPYQYYLTGLAIGVDTTIMQSCEKLDKDHFDWNNIIAHSKAYTVIEMLENLIRKEIFEKVVRQILMDHGGKIVYESEFKTSCEQISGQELNWFFSQWLHTNMKLDYRIMDVVETQVSGKHHIKVRVKSFGDARMPIPVKVIFQDNQEETKIVEKNLDESELNFMGSSPMKEVMLDPYDLLPLTSKIKEIEPRRLGYVLFNSGKYKEAAEKLKESLRQSPGDAIAYFFLGLCLYDIGEYDESLGAFREVIRLMGSNNTDPWNAWSHIWIGHIFDVKGRREEAIEEYEEAIATSNTITMQFSQYGINSDAVTWAKQRTKNPFVRTKSEEL